VAIRYAGRHTVTGTFTFKIGKHELAQVFGSKATTGPGAGGTPLWLLIAAGVATLLAGFVAAAVYFKRRERRIAELLRERDERDRGELELWPVGPGAVADAAPSSDDDAQHPVEP
jgi:hypothetical protein